MKRTGNREDPFVHHLGLRVVSTHPELITQVAELLLNAGLHALPRFVVRHHALQGLFDPARQLNRRAGSHLDPFWLQPLARFLQQPLLRKETKPSSGNLSSLLVSGAIFSSAGLIALDDGLLHAEILNRNARPLLVVHEADEMVSHLPEPRQHLVSG